MAEDCEKLSAKAQEIFNKLEPFYPPILFKDGPSIRWKPEGLVHDNTWHDLRKSADRQKLIETRLRGLGNWVFLEARIYRDDHKGSLAGFEHAHFTKVIAHAAEHYLILMELDFQIETMDIVEWQPPPAA